MPVILPAILTNDPEDFAKKMSALNQWAPIVHIDVADGKFVNNTTLSVQHMLGVACKIFQQWHLTINNPLPVVDLLLSRQVHSIVVHVETIPDPAGFVRRIINEKLPIIIALKPTTPLEEIATFDDQIQTIMLMGVVPGFQGQPFIPETLDRIRLVREHAPYARIIVDGGVRRENIQTILRAGASELVAGSAIWQAPDPQAAYQEYEQLAVETSL